MDHVSKIAMRSDLSARNQCIATVSKEDSMESGWKSLRYPSGMSSIETDTHGRDHLKALIKFRINVK